MEENVYIAYLLTNITQKIGEVQPKVLTNSDPCENVSKKASYQTWCWIEDVFQEELMTQNPTFQLIKAFLNDVN